MTREQFFSHRTYPILNWIEKKEISLDNLFYPVDIEAKVVKNMAEKVHFAFMGLMNRKAHENIQYISNPFHDAIERAGEQMLDKSLWNTVEPQTGVLLMPNNIQIMYAIMETGFEHNMHSSLMLTLYREKLLAFSFQDPINKTNTVWASLELANKVKNNIELEGLNLIGAVTNSIYEKLIATLNFIKYAEIETKELAPKKKIRDIACKYFNNTKSNITILDSKWFTTIVNNNSFKVNGHFRLQPYGEGSKKRKLIWINEFQKKGYNRLATKSLL